MVQVLGPRLSVHDLSYFILNPIFQYRLSLLCIVLIPLFSYLLMESLIILSFK